MNKNPPTHNHQQKGVIDRDIVVSEFEPQSHYYAHFATYTPGKYMESLIPLSYGLNSTTTIFFFLPRWLWH